MTFCGENVVRHDKLKIDNKENMPTLRQIIVRWANPFLANLNIGQKWVNSVCVRASVCVCVCVFWGEGVGGFVERTLNYLKQNAH